MHESSIHPAEPRRVCLAQLPTPLVELPRLAGELGVPKILAKRDDLTGLELTGNKVRKLEYLVAEAIDNGCDTLVTMGGWQSNHCRATAAVAARLGLSCRLILRAPSDVGENPVPRVGNLLLDELLGARVSLYPPRQYNADRQTLIDSVLAEERAAGRRPYFFGVGGSTPLGCWGYVRAMHELIAQVTRSERLDLYLALSSCGTMAGALAGRFLFGLHNVRVVGVLVSDDEAYFRREVPRHLREFAETFSLPTQIAEEELHLLPGHVGEGYAIETPGAIEAMRRVARVEGLLLDPVYTAKSMDGMIAAIKRRETDATPIFLHTGGVFGLLARTDLFRQQRS